jgi:hypothetical protein
MNVPSGKLRVRLGCRLCRVIVSPATNPKFVNATELVIDGGQTASVTGKVWEQ